MGSAPEHSFYFALFCLILLYLTLLGLKLKEIRGVTVKLMLALLEL